MNKSIWRTALLTSALTLSMPLIGIAEHPEHPKAEDTAAEETLTMIGDEANPVREDIALVSLEASVEAIDYDLRDVTLKGPGGNTFTVTADLRVERLDEIEVGDMVSVDYLKSVLFELRKPTIEELEEPLVILDETAKAPEDMAPGVGEITMIRAVCTIEGLDRQTMTAKLLGPLGGYNIVGVADPENLTKLRIGDTVIVTYTEAVAIGLVKAEEIEEEIEEEMVEEEIEEEMEAAG